VPEDTESIRQEDRDTIWIKVGELNERMMETILGKAAFCILHQILLTLIQRVERRVE